MDQLTPAEKVCQLARKLDGLPDLGLGDLIALHGKIKLSDAEIDALTRPDPAHAYGRRVLLATDDIEVMVATWTRGLPCDPHDHGGQWGAVKVLRGQSRHKIWALRDGALEVAYEHAVRPGEVIQCGPDVIHSMGDDAAADALVTLHLYTRSIPHMVVYDVQSERTYVVDGGCGAWIPHDQPELILASRQGLAPRAAVLASA